ncbi:hypothetical protein TNCT_625841 [Trichonephila clavata]|uniref:PiggyBac transposable element-derived protein domain-containing protein n=1 Tax=Trichonephila clavata TaxID=2740835 RepID=A0A8X6GC52_TRICU|nr:hypothetical protein TNCT_625841 [Trichonephila clavata]
MKSRSGVFRCLSSQYAIHELTIALINRRKNTFSTTCKIFDLIFPDNKNGSKTLPLISLLEVIRFVSNLSGLRFMDKSKFNRQKAVFSKTELFTFVQYRRSCYNTSKMRELHYVRQCHLCSVNENTFKTFGRTGGKVSN